MENPITFFQKMLFSLDLPPTFDLVQPDGAKALYRDMQRLREERLVRGAPNVADNADDSTDYLMRARSSTGGYLSKPFTDDIELPLKLG
ncbi:hypothetical protein [Paludibacterium paludis]|uniref:Uncharacterized protein n=1 Tax=Paludibacterium paludis TaxID=1225769 RepID=A0A918P4E8_9NEIS|nr:hypothetical protein [Paludibacterium paludis]GGY21802.1 hypothetical protein GCM10011289_26910 [Paludibacterium paludis]